ncbi:MAG: glycosyltransferase family 2 protein [Thermoleophilaceae bacterium]
MGAESREPVTVAIPVLNGGMRLAEVLAAVRGQRLERPVELVIADSGSTDGSAAVARHHGAEVISVAPSDFSHGATRNLLFERASGSHVAFLTQDAVPADESWLARLLEGFELAEEVALVFGPYRPRPEASATVARELQEWFASFAPDGQPRVDRGAPQGIATDRRLEFFTDANGCVARWAWERVPFQQVAYAEDQLLARDMLAEGYAKTYHPGAVVLHSHDYSPVELFRRRFDEWRGLHEVRGAVAQGNPLAMALAVQRQVRDDLGYLRRRGAGRRPLVRAAAASLTHHVASSSGAALGSRAKHMPERLRRACSLDGRGEA